MKKRDWPVAPLILGFILGPMLEQNLRSSLQTSGGSLDIFITRPISAIFITVAVALVILSRRMWTTISNKE